MRKSSQPSALLYGQAGGVTAVINASAAAVIRAAREAGVFKGIYAARYGIEGVLNESLVDTAALDEADLAALAATPGGAFGACRFDLSSAVDNPDQYDRLFEVFAAHRIGTFLYNGGNGSMDTVVRIAAAARERNYPLRCIGIPKTIDNDLAATDTAPGFGSAAKYLATSMLECAFDLAAMSKRGDSSGARLFVLETMGRNAGWLAAATALAADDDNNDGGRERCTQAPHAIILPEAHWQEEALYGRVETALARHGYCAIAVGEGARQPGGGDALAAWSASGSSYVQFGGAGHALAQKLRARFGLKTHWAIADYLQRAGGHLVSATDRAQAEAVGAAAVAAAVRGESGVMCAIERTSDAPYRWQVFSCDAASVANLERLLPAHFIAADGLHITAAARHYLRPLIAGECPPLWQANGLPRYWQADCPPLAQQLPPYRARQQRR